MREERKKKKIRNLRTGDVVYFNYQADIAVGEQEQAKGVVVGDGIASDQLHCVPRDILCKSNAQLNFRKSLFEIMAVQEEEESEKKGLQVTYGMFVQLRHVYSNCMLTLKREHLAEQNGCVKITLEEESTQEGHFRFMAANSLQLQGQFIQYTDKVVLSGLEGNLHLQISGEARGEGPADLHSFMEGLEVNASEIGTPLKVSSYIDYLESRNRQAIAQKYLRNGDLVYLHNNHLGSHLAVQYPSLASHTRAEKLFYRDQEFQMNRVAMEKVYEQQSALQVKVEKDLGSTRLQINALWEIQQSQVFDGSLPQDTGYFKIKNLSTGLLLSCTAQGRLALTADSADPHTRFQLKLKKHASQNDHKIPYLSSLIVRTAQAQLLTVQGDKVSCLQKNTNYASFTFELRPVEAQLQNIGDRICSLYPQLLSFLHFLQDYGMSRQERYEGKVTVYQTRQRQDRQRALESEVLQLFQSLQNLEDFLSTDSNTGDSSKDYKLKQYSLQDMQILDLLVQITMTIDSLRFLDYYQSPGSLLQDQMDRPPSAALLVCHPLNQAQTQIYQMVQRIVLGNRRISEYLIRQGHFQFLLSQYAQSNSSTVQAIMKEVVHNALDTQGLDLHQWTDYLQRLDLVDSRQRHLNQIFAIEVVSQIMVHKARTPLKDRQQQVRTWLFKQNLPQGLLHFSLLDGVPRLFFLCQGLDEAFFSRHSALQGLEEPDHSFRLDRLADSNKQVGIYVTYVAAYISLLANLCAGRNEKGIKMVEHQFSLTPQLIMAVLQSPTSIVIKAAFRSLLLNTYLDLNPMKRLTQFNNKNIIYDDICELDPQAPCYKLIGQQFYEQLNRHQKGILDNYASHRNAFMNSWTKGLEDTDLSLLQAELIQDTYSSQLSLAVTKKMKALITFLQFSRQVIDLGYTSRYENKQIIEQIEGFLQAKQKSRPGAQERRSNWIFYFLNSLSSIQWACASDHQLLTEIYSQLLEIVCVTDRIAILIEQDQFLFQMVQKALPKTGLAYQAKQLRRHFFRLIIDPSSYQPKNSFDLVMTPRLSRSIYKMINTYCDRNDVLSQQLLNVVLINNRSEIDFFQAFGGFIVREDSEEQDESIIINPMFFKKQIARLKEENLKMYVQKQESCGQDKVDKLLLKQQKTISSIEAILCRSIQEISTLKYDVFKTGQQILKNFQLQDVVVQILQVEHYDESYKRLFKQVITFLERFGQDNHENQLQLLAHYDTLVQVVHYGVSIRRLFSIMLDHQKEQPDIARYINDITDRLHFNASQGNHFQCHEFLSILLSLTKNRVKSTIRSSQHLILVKLLEIEELKEFLGGVSYYEYTKRLVETGWLEQSIRKKENNQLDTQQLMRLSAEVKESKWFQRLESHLGTIRLLSACAAEYSLGMQSVRQVVSHQALASLFFDDNPTLFQVKLPYLRLYFNVFVLQDNTHFRLEHMVNIFKRIVLVDLKQFLQYLEGLISIDYEEESKVEEAQKRRIKIKGVVQKRVPEQRTNNRLNNNKMNTTNQFSDNTSVSNNRSRTVHDPSEYWDYLVGGDVFDNSKDGLLHFVVDCLQEVKRRKWLQTDKESELGQVLRQVKGEAERLQNSLKRIEQGQEEECLDNLNLLVKSLIVMVPEVQVQRAGYAVNLQGGEFSAEEEDLVEESQQDQDQQKKEKDDVLHSIRTHILARRITTQDFFGMFRYEDLTVDAGKYLGDLNALLDGSSLSTQQLMAHLSLLKVGFLDEGRTCIYFKALVDLVIMLLEHNQVDNRLLDEIKQEMANIREKSHWDKETKQQDLVLERNKLLFLQSTSSSAHREQHINHLLSALHNSYGQNDKHEFLKCFMSQFGESAELLYMLKIIRRSLSHDLKHNKDSTRVQLQYHHSQTTQLVLSLIKEDSPENIVYESILILNSLLDSGNLTIQQDILALLKSNHKEAKFGLFSFLKSTINRFKHSMSKAKERVQVRIYSPQEFYQQVGKVSSQVMIKQVLFLLQLLCENCNNNLQNYLSQQVQDDAQEDLTCINIVKETADLLSAMIYNKDVQKCIFTRTSIGPEELKAFRPDEGLLLNISDSNQLRTEFNVIVDQCFQTLTDFCVGPCGNNQQLLCEDLKLITYINENILRHEHQFDLEELDNEVNQSHINVLSSCIKYLLIITIGNQNQSNLHTLIDRLEVRRLMEKMKDIYQKAIRVREEQIVSQKHFDYKGANYSSLWKRESGRFNDNLHDFNEWYYARQHQHFNQIIRLGFNIFILFFFIDVKENTDLRFENLKGQQSTIYNKYVNARKKNECNEEIKKILQDQKQQKQQLLRQQQEELNNEKQEQQGKAELSMEDMDESMRLLSKDNKKKSGMVKDTGNDEVDALQEKVDKQIEKVNNTYNLFKVQMDEHEKYDRCCNFYKVFVDSVEIAKESNGNKQLFKLYFPKEYLSKFITSYIRKSIIKNVSMPSDQDRIRHFFEGCENYSELMEYRQKLSRMPPVLFFFINNWSVFKDISFYFIVFINIWLVSTLSKDTATDTVIYGQSSSTTATVKNILEVIQMLMAFIIYISCIISRYKVCLCAASSDNTAQQKQYLQHRIQQSGSSLSLISRVNLFLRRETGGFYKVLLVLFYQENLFNFIFLVLSITAYFNEIFHSFLLLDVVKSSEDLQNIFKSLTLNSSSLAKTFFLFFIIVYLFSIFGFLFLSKYYVESNEQQESNHANSLLQGFISTFNNGLRSGGGIGDTLDAVSISSADYWTMYVFQLLFFVVINILFINIIFGIIIDTFGQLRDQRQELMKKIQEGCYICGLNRNDFENRGKGQMHHIYLERNLYNYLHFIIYIRNMESQECNGLEKYVKDLIVNNNHSFIPIGQAICLEQNI